MSMYRDTPPSMDYRNFPKWLVYLISIGGMFLLIYIFAFAGETNYFTETYSGRVIEKFIDKEDSDVITVILDNNQKVKFHFMAKNFYSIIQIDDMLEKEKYSLTGYLRKRNVTIPIHYPLSF